MIAAITQTCLLGWKVLRGSVKGYNFYDILLEVITKNE